MRGQGLTATCGCQTLSHDFPYKTCAFAEQCTHYIPLSLWLALMKVERSQSILSCRSRSSQSSNYLGESSSPWYTKDSSPLPGNSLLSRASSISSDVINTQELRDEVVDLMNESAKNARRYCVRNHGEDPDSDGSDAER